MDWRSEQYRPAVVQEDEQWEVMNVVEVKGRKISVGDETDDCDGMTELETSTTAMQKL